MIIKAWIPIVCHPNRWWNFCVSEDEKKEIEPTFTEQCFMQYGSIRTF